MMKPVFLGKKISVWQRATDEPRVIVTFSSFKRDATNDLQITAAEWIKKAKCAQVHVKANMPDWYTNDEFLPALAVVYRQTRFFDRRFYFGISMGGFGALLFGSLVAADHIVAVSPQFVPGTEHRPISDIDSSVTSFGPSLSTLIPEYYRGAKTTLIYDHSHRMDRRHIQSIANTLRSCSLVDLRFGGHPAIKRVVKSTGFTCISDLVLDRYDAARLLLNAHRRCLDEELGELSARRDLRSRWLPKPSIQSRWDGSLQH